MGYFLFQLLDVLSRAPTADEIVLVKKGDEHAKPDQY